MLTFAQKSNVRRHLDYPVVGLLKTSPAGGSVASPFNGYRFFQTYGRLEYKLNNLNPDEEARLCGLGYASVALVGPNPVPGDTISVTLGGGAISSPQTVTATMTSFGVGQAGLPVLGNNLAMAAQQNTVLAAAGVVCLTPYGTGPFNENELPLTEVAFTAPFTFSLTYPTGSGVIVPQVTATGAQLPPVSQVDGITTVWGYLGILDALESAWPATSQNLDTAKAGPWQARMSEAAARASLYQNWQVKLSQFLEIPVYNGNCEPGRSKFVNPSRMM